MNEGSLPWWTPRAVLTCVMKRRLSGAIAAVNRILPVHARSVPGPARPLLRQNRTKRHVAPPARGGRGGPAGGGAGGRGGRGRPGGGGGGGAGAGGGAAPGR